MLPLGVRLAVDQDGKWSVAAGIATPVGTFGISHTFATRGDFTYIVLRDHNRGTDQVFKVGTTGHVAITTNGESRILLQPDKQSNKWVIDVNSISGYVDIEVVPTNSVLSIVDCGEGAPSFIIMQDGSLVVERPGWFSTSDRLHLSSIESVSLNKWTHRPEYWIHFAPKEAASTAALSVQLGTMNDKSEFEELEKFIRYVSPNVTCEHMIHKKPSAATVILVVAFLISSGCGVMCGLANPDLTFVCAFLGGPLLMLGSVMGFVVQANAVPFDDAQCIELAIKQSMVIAVVSWCIAGVLCSAVVHKK